MASKDNQYHFIQKVSNVSDDKFAPYYQNVSSYMTNVILLGNTMVVYLMTILLKETNKLPNHGMLGKLVISPNLKISKKLKNKMLVFNKSLTLVKHSVMGMSEERIEDPTTLLLVDLKSRKLTSISKRKQEITILLAQEILSELRKFL